MFSLQVLSGIFKDCLDKAEDTGLTSISLPAIGTGNLGFPRDLVANLMLKEISAFSIEKQPKHLKKVDIVLYSGDAQTIQVRKQKEALSYFQMEINSMTNQ